MSGALNSVMMRRGARRRYAEGGDVDQDGTPDTEALPVPPIPPAQQPLTQDQQIALAEKAMANLQSQQQTRNILAAGGIQTPTIIDPATAPGATNLPLLAAAGAMLQPTKSGGFSEALGRAFEAAVPVAQQQRQLAESAQLRKAQMEQNAAIWGQRVDVQRQRADTYDKQTDARVAYYEAQAAKLSASTGPNGEKFKYIGNSPDGLPIMQGDRGTMRLGDIPVGLTTDQEARDLRGNRRIDETITHNRTTESQRADQIRNSQDFHEQKARLDALKMDDANRRALMTRAVTLSAATGRPLKNSMDQILEQRPRVQLSPTGAPTAPAHASGVNGQTPPVANFFQ